MSSVRHVGALLLAGSIALAFSGQSALAQAAFTITSSSFKDGARLATKMAGNNKQNPNCVGDNVSPQLSWSGAPAGIKSYALTMVGGGKRERWLLVKMDDEAADARRNPVKTEPESVLTGRTIEEVASRGPKTRRRAG